MEENQTPDPLTPEERQLVDELSQPTNRADLLNRARNNKLGVNERVLAALNAEARDLLYTIVGEVEQEFATESEERQQPTAQAALQDPLDEPPASTVPPTEGGKEHDAKELTNREILQLLKEIEDMHNAQDPPESEPADPADVGPSGGETAPSSTFRKPKP